MHYRHTLEIHERLESVLRLIKTGHYSTPALAEKVGVSIPTISRIVAALREQGHEIRAERAGRGWFYTIDGSQTFPQESVWPDLEARNGDQPR